MKKIKIGLLPRIIIAIILGIAIGTVFPAPLVRIFVTFNGIFSEFLNFSIPLIILGLVTIAIADIGKGAGKMLLVTALIAYGATLFSGFLSYFTGMAVFPSLIEVGAPLEEVSEAHGILPYFSVSIPPLMNVMTALILAFTLGLGQRFAEKCSAGFSGNHRAYDQRRHPALAAALHLRHFSEHDSFRTSICHPDGIYQDYRSHLPVTYFPARLSVFHCSDLCP